VDLRKHAKDKQCQVRIPGICNRDPATTVLAHVRLAGITGVGQKAPDLLACWCCSECHSYCDSRRNDRDQLAFMHGVLRTQYQLIKDGIVNW